MDSDGAERPEWTAADEAEYIAVGAALREIRARQNAAAARMHDLVRGLEARLWEQAGCPRWWYAPPWLQRMRSRLPAEPLTVVVIPDDVSELFPDG